MKARKDDSTRMGYVRMSGAFVALIAFVGALLIGTVPAGAVAVPDTVGDVRFEDRSAFERAIIDLRGENGPTDAVPEYAWQHTNGDWIVRINLPTAKSTLTTDGSGLGVGVSRYYVVRGADGSLAVYLRLSKPAGPVKVFARDHPSRIVVDVRPKGLPLYPEPAEGKEVVVVHPRLAYLVGPGAFMVRGYGRPFEARGAWRLKDQAGRIVRRGTYTTNDWASTWGTFAFEATYPNRLAGKTGTLQVGQYLPADGRFRGTTVPLRFR
jgi:hypothetical protein